MGNERRVRSISRPDKGCSRIPEGILEEEKFSVSEKLDKESDIAENPIHTTTSWRVVELAQLGKAHTKEQVSVQC